MREVQDLVKESEQTNTTINNELRALERNIDELGSRLEDLEKLDIRTSGELSSILKELETLRKNMETYQMIISLRGKND
jgi:chromosome segregation ATPase